MFTNNYSLSTESTIWNNTISESTVLFHHPILYGLAIYALFLIIIGTIGNILTIIILLRPNLRQYTTMRYLIAVAIADLSSLYSWNLNLFYKHLINPYQNDLEDSSILLCRFISFMAFVSLQLSSWYLTLVSLDRCLNIHFLFWHRKIGRANYVIYITLIVTIIIVLINSHLLFLNGYQQSNCIPFKKRTCIICYSHPNDPYYIFPKWEKIHVIIYNLIPFSIMLISNCFIIRRSIPSTMIRTVSIDTKKRLSQNYRQRKQKRLTYLLLFVTFLFVLLTTPVMIYNVFLRNLLIDRKPLKYILQGILLSMQFTSHAINFFVYCYGASIFRYELNEFLTSSIFKRS
ncbi:unnamed protein product [Adineta steineri]|uniref:G-protein coupled receptors family 1 profile domain-containing protein n=1 Tax=Adineta steineri TaxID=433720 RepID=A0A819S3W2_9BILA|nr:unnamed protein product [Adineta steineri]